MRTRINIALSQIENVEDFVKNGKGRTSIEHDAKKPNHIKAQGDPKQLLNILLSQQWNNLPADVQEALQRHRLTEKT